ncbi:MAG: acyl-CoA dehydrogenase family protein [Dehalococcoidia bacterium]
MDFGFSSEQEAFRREVQDWLGENMTPEIQEELEIIDHPAQRGPHIKELFKKLGEKGWIGISWPKEHGGQGGSRLDQYILEEELARVELSGGGGGTGGPAIMVAGTAEQKEYFLPGLIKGEIIFAAGYTEPSAGADLASLQCRAVRDGDFYVINGQKMFTSAANFCTHVYLMCRTDPDAPKHRGISILLVPIDTPGITIRPLWTIQNNPRAPLGTTYGHARTNETFFEDVRVPASALLGDENMGWYIGAGALNLDRVGAHRYLISVQRDEDVINWAKENRLGDFSLAESPAIRERMVELWIEAQVCRLMTMRSMSIVEHGGNFTYEGSAEKVWAPEHGVRNAESVSQMFGPYATLLAGSVGAPKDGLYAHQMMGAFQSGINHGSVQVMRDQVARRGLGMPRG